MIQLDVYMTSAQEVAFDPAVPNKNVSNTQDLSCEGKKPYVSAKKNKAYDELISKTQAAYGRVLGLRARFEQISSLLGMSDNFESSGRLLFLKPGKMNWEYESPKKQKFVSNGSKVWFYEPDVNQVTIGELSKSFDSQVPVSFLLGVGQIAETFDGLNACLSDKGIILDLKPKAVQPNLKSFTLLLDKNTFLPLGARIVDSGDTSTQFVFFDLTPVDNLNPEEFEFVIPSGVDIVNHSKKEE